MAKANQPRNPGLYNGMPSVTGRRWGPDRSDPGNTFGPRELRGYGDFTTPDTDRQDAGAERGHRGKGPAGYVRPDASIADDIIDRLTDDDTLDATHILLQVDGGIAILTGSVPVRAMKHRAEDVAAAASGVRDVRNRIRVDA